MPKITLKDVSEITTGTILKQLIKEKGFKNQKEFANAFNDWLDENNYTQAPITEKDVSRWLNGTVKPRNNKLQLFAYFFDVNLEFLQCKEPRKHRFNPKKMTLLNSASEDNTDLLKSIKEAEQFEKLQEYCKSLGYQFDYIPSKHEEITTDYQVIRDGKIYTIEIMDTIHSEPDLSIEFPDGSTITPNEELLRDFTKNVNHALEYEFHKLKERTDING